MRFQLHCHNDLVEGLHLHLSKLLLRAPWIHLSEWQTSQFVPCFPFLRGIFCAQVRALLSLRENFCSPLRTFAFLNRCTRMCRNHFSSRVVAGYAFYMLRQHSAKELPHEVSPSVTLFVLKFVLCSRSLRDTFCDPVCAHCYKPMFVKVKKREKTKVYRFPLLFNCGATAPGGPPGLRPHQ